MPDDEPVAITRDEKAPEVEGREIDLCLLTWPTRMEIGVEAKELKAGWKKTARL